MSLASLSGVLVKIDRAKAHLADFDTEAAPIIAASQQAVVREYDEQRSEHVFRIERVPVVPPVLGTIIGDAIHNLRVSLDHLAWQLAIATGRIPDSGTRFPIFMMPPSLDRWGHICMDTQMILDELQPYQRSKPANHELAVLSALDNIDKHHVLLGTIIGVRDPGAIGWRGEADITAINFGPYHDGDVICRFASSVDSEGEFDAMIRFALGFNEPAAGAWGSSLGAARLVRLSLVYIEQKVIPRFQDYF